MTATTPEDDVLLKTSEVAEELNISSRHVHKLIETGELRAVRFGVRIVRVYQSSVLALKAGGEVECR